MAVFDERTASSAELVACLIERTLLRSIQVVRFVMLSGRSIVQYFADLNDPLFVLSEEIHDALVLWPEFLKLAEQLSADIRNR